jgi:mannose-6-phosphate isomerase-like protein (cupin superfamily)
MTLVLTEAVAAGGGAYMAPLHTHDRDDEAFYVLEGTLAFRLADDEITVPAGGHVVIPAGTVHTFWNPSGEPARYLLVMTGAIPGLIEALHDPAETRDIDALFRAYDSTLIGWP